MKITVKSVKSWAIWCERQSDKRHDVWEKDLWTNYQGIVQLYPSRKWARRFGKPVRVTITVEGV